MRTRNKLAYLIWLLVFIFPIGYSFFHSPDPQFRDNFLGNWAAATLGVILGIPIAIALSRWQQREQDKRQQDDKQRQQLEHQRKILEILRFELIENQEVLEWSFNNIREQQLPGFRDMVWKAFSDSGEIQWIDNPELLNTIATAYLYTKTLIRLDAAQDTLFFSNIQIAEPMGSAQGRRIIEGRNTTHPHAQQSMRRAIEEIEGHLSQMQQRKLIEA